MARFEVDDMLMFYKSVLLTPDFTALISSRHNLLGQIRYIPLRLVASYCISLSNLREPQYSTTL